MTNATLYFPSTSARWETVDPVAAGWNPDALDRAVEVAVRQHSTGVLFLSGGRRMVERYAHGGPDTAASDISSAQKSVMSMLVSRRSLDRTHRSSPSCWQCCLFAMSGQHLGNRSV